MGRSRYKIYEEIYPYFITASIIEGLPIFSIPQAAKIILEALSFLQDKRKVKVIAYVIMENHIHVILKGENLSAKIGSFKSYTARQIIDILQESGLKRILRQLRSMKKSHKIGQSHQLWQEGFHPKQIIGDDMMVQKIEYIHDNPVKRGYVDKPEHWRYSSARNYSKMESIIPVNLFGGGGTYKDPV